MLTAKNISKSVISVPGRTRQGEPCEPLTGTEMGRTEEKAGSSERRIPGAQAQCWAAKGHLHTDMVLGRQNSWKH